MESYEEEMTEWATLIQEHFDDRELTVLDLGTGGGHHLFHLLNQLPQIKGGLGVDLAEPMLERAQELNSRFEFRQGDMTALTLDRSFDLITVHDSFCYLHEEEKVKALFTVIASHLKADGLCLLKLDATEDSFTGPYRYLTTFEEDDFEVTLTHYEWDPVNEDGKLEVLYQFIERRGAELRTREERHELGLFPKKQLQSLATAADLKGEFVEIERWDEERENVLLKLTNSVT